MSLPNLSDLEPKELWAEFYHICTVPRGSGNLDGIRAALKQRAEQRGLRTVIEEASGNLLIVKEADAGYESKPCICLQGHMDMVCSKRSDNPHNFLKDPIRPRLEMVDGQLCMLAHGTTLGADNGIGVAAALALVFDKSFKSGRIEVLCTTDEETTMFGAQHLSPSLLTAKILLNLDSEDFGIITVGSCSGFCGRFDFSPALPVSSCPSGKGIKVSVAGLTGGHSGVDIHLQRGNAIKLMGRMLALATNPQHSAKLFSLVGGTADNAIPMDCSASLCVTEAAESIIADLKTLASGIMREYRTTDPGISITVEAIGCPGSCVDALNSRRIADLITVLPSGVLRMSPEVEGMTESSMNLGIMKFDAKNLKESVIYLLPRSSYSSYLTHVDELLYAISRHCDVASYSGAYDAYSGWVPDPSSKLCKTCRAKCAALQGKSDSDVRIEAVHAGLECGEIIGHYPSMQAISIGPTIKHPHSDRELCEVASVPLFYTWLKDTIRGILDE